MSDITMKTVAEKLLRTKKFSSLDPLEIEFLRGIAGVPCEEPVEEAKKPILSWLLKDYVRYWPYIRRGISEELGHEKLLKVARLEIPSGNIDMCKLLATITLPELRAVLVRMMDERDLFGCSTALLLSGLTGSRELANPVLSVLKELVKGEGSFVSTKSANAISALAMLHERDAAPTVVRFVKDTEEKVRESCYLYYNELPECISDAELGQLLQDDHDPRTWMQFPDLLHRAVELLNLEAVISGLRSIHNVAPPDHCASILAPALVKTGSARFITDLLDGSDGVFQIAVLSEACWSNRKDLAPVFHQKAIVDADDNPLGGGSQWLNLVASYTVEPPGDAQLRAALSAHEYSMIPALWATLGRTEFEEELGALSKHQDSRVRYTARMISALNHGVEPAEFEYLVARLVSPAGATPPAFLARAFSVRGIPLPSLLEFHAVLSEGWNMDRALAFFRRHPLYLLGYLTERKTKERPRILEEDLGKRMVLFASVLLGDDRVRRQLENVLIAATNGDEIGSIGILLEATGGFVTESGRTLFSLALSDGKHAERVGNDVVPVLAALAAVGEMPMAEGLIASVAKTLKNPGEWLELLLDHTFDPKKSDAAAAACTAAGEDSDPMLEEISRAMSDQLSSVKSLPNFERLAVSNASQVRRRIARILGSNPEELAQFFSAFLVCCLDDDEEVAKAAIGSLGQSAGLPWIQHLLIDATIDDGDISEQAAYAMGESCNPVFLPRLIEILGTAINLKGSRDHRGKADAAMTAIERIAGRHPECGYIALSAGDANDVKSRYNLTEDRDWRQDDFAEALRLLVAAFEKQADPGFAREKLGARMLLTPVAPENALAHPMQQVVCQNDFERLAAYLNVHFVDESTHTIVAEVGDRPSGQIVNALFEETKRIVFRAVWG
jgi:hypothetical protein